MAERLFYIRGEIDMATAPAVESSLNEAVAGGDTDLAVDCRDLTFIDSRGVLVLIDAQRQLQAGGRSLRVVNANYRITRVLEVMGLVEFLRIDANGNSDLDTAKH